MVDVGKEGKRNEPETECSNKLMQMKRKENNVVSCNDE